MASASFQARLNALRKIAGIFDRREKFLLLGLTGMMVGGALLEVLGIGAVTAFVALLAEPDLATANPALKWVAQNLGHPSFGTPIMWLGACLVMLFMLKNGYLAFLAYRQVRFSYNKERRLSKALLSSYLSQPYDFFLRRNSAELMRNVTHEVSHVITGIVMPALSIVSEFIVLAFVLIMLAMVEPVAAIAAGLLLGSTAFAFAQVVKPLLRHHGRERAGSAESRIRWVNQAIGSVKELKLLGCADYFVDAFDYHSNRYARAGLVANTLNGLPRLIMETVAVIALMLVVLISTAQGKELKSMLPTLTLFALAAMRIMPSINRIVPAVNQIRFWLPSIETVHADLNIGNNELQAPEENKPPGQEKLLTSEIRTEALGFSYAGADRPALSNLTLRIPRGASVGFMGASGAGKSTLIDLLLGLIEPTEGRIFIDDRALPEVCSAWQRHVGYVPQFIYLLDDSVRRNVALGIPDDRIDDDRVWASLKQARLDVVVQRLPQGLANPIGERGVRLSGGERQRLGIARALYRNPEVIVFDEATSALDNQTEREIADTVRSLAQDRTILIVAHRTTTVKDCDVVYFLRNGELLAQGPFDELLENNAEFRATVQQGT